MIIYSRNVHTNITLISTDQYNLSNSRIPAHNHKFDINAHFSVSRYPRTITSLISMQTFQFLNTRAQSQVWYLMQTFQFLDTRAQSQIWYQCNLSNSRIPAHKNKFDINAIFPVLGYPRTTTSLISMQSFQFLDTRAQLQVWYQCNLSNSRIPAHKHKFDMNANFPVSGYPWTIWSFISMQFFLYSDTHAHTQVWYQCDLKDTRAKCLITSQQ